VIEIIPAIIANTPEELRNAIAKLEGKTKRASVDIMDGIFVPAKTVGPQEILDIKTDLKLEAHLMVQDPENWVPKLLETDIESISIQIESEGDIKKLLQEIKDSRKKRRLVLNPDTEIDSAIPYLDLINAIQFMTVYPGKYGAPFVEKIIPKIKEFHSRYPDIPIAVDGGVNPETAPKLVTAGASILISGSYIIQSANIEEAINNLQSAY